MKKLYCKVHRVYSKQKLEKVFSTKFFFSKNIYLKLDESKIYRGKIDLDLQMISPVSKFLFI